MHAGLMLLFPIYPVISYGLLLMVLYQLARENAYKFSTAENLAHLRPEHGSSVIYAPLYWRFMVDTLPCHREEDIGNGTEIVY